MKMRRTNKDIKTVAAWLDALEESVNRRMMDIAAELNELKKLYIDLKQEYDSLKRQNNNETK